MSDTCKWERDHNGYYVTECGDVFNFEVGDGIATSGLRFCPYCGDEIVDKGGQS
jgi:hypothetical protein